MSESKATNSSAPRAVGGNSRPLIGITMGDPAGIGAEVVVKALADPEVRRQGRFVAQAGGQHPPLQPAPAKMCRR